MTGPRVVIELEIEERPQVREEALSEEDAIRLRFWIKSQASLRQLVEDALRIRQAA